MAELPSKQVLEEARTMAVLKGRAVYVYRQKDGWHVGEELKDIPGDAYILAIRPDTDDDEIINFGGC